MFLGKSIMSKIFKYPYYSEVTLLLLETSPIISSRMDSPRCSHSDRLQTNDTKQTNNKNLQREKKIDEIIIW